MAALTLRSAKGSRLTNAEVDANFTALNDDVASRLLASAYTAADVLSKIGASGQTVWHTGNLTNLSQLANGPGYITASASISGNAATATRLATPRTINGQAFDGSANITVADNTKQVALYDGWVVNPGVDANLLSVQKVGFTYSNNAPYTGPLVHLGADAYSLQINAQYQGEAVAVRNRNGDSGTWNAWRSLWHSGNFNPGDYSLTTHTHGALTSLGQQSVQTGRNVFANGVYTYTAYGDANAPATYIAGVGFGNGVGGSAEIAANWIGQGSYGMWYRSLRDTTDSWTNWTPLVDSHNFVNYWNGQSTLATLNGYSPTNGVMRMTPNFALNAPAAYAVLINWDNGSSGSNQQLRVGNGAGADAFYVQANGLVWAAGDILATTMVSGSRVSAGYDANTAGSISCNNWFRTTNNTGIYFADYGVGLRAPQTAAYGSVGTYGSRGGYSGYSWNDRFILMSSSSNTEWGIYDGTNGWYQYYDVATNNCHFKGNVIAYSTTISDRRLKKDIKQIRGALQRLLQLTGVTYTMIKDGAVGIGLIAQDVLPQFPEAITEVFAPRQPGDKSEPESFLTVAYGHLVGPIIEALREIDARIGALEAAR